MWHHERQALPCRFANIRGLGEACSELMCDISEQIRGHAAIRNMRFQIIKHHKTYRCRCLTQLRVEAATSDVGARHREI
jgi:hypothetical protein